MITIYPDPKDAAITGLQTDVSGLTTDIATLTADVAVIDANVDAIKADTDAYLDAAISSITPGKSQATVFTASGTFTPASGVTLVYVTMVGGGAGGGGSGSGASEYGGAGGGGRPSPYPLAGASKWRSNCHHRGRRDGWACGG